MNGVAYMETIFLSSPHMGGAEIQYINDAFEKNWISPLGENVNGFEEDLESYLGEEKKVACLSSGTAAIHLALILAGVKKGDEVVCQSFTFSASCNPIAYLGAKPIFVGSEKESWNLDPQALEDCLKNRINKGSKPKAVIVVHLYGASAMMDEIVRICKKYDVKLIEDAAEALGSSYDGQKLGTFGDFGVLSFNGNKIITTSGGGALVTSRSEDKEKAIFLATQAREPALHYEHREIGYNYRLSNICAGIGRGQMTVLDRWVEKRRANFAFYKKSLENFFDVTFQGELASSFSNRWLSALTLELAENKSIYELIGFLKERKIEARPLWKPMHLQPVFSECPYYGDRNSEVLFSKGICLPSGSNLSNEDINRVVSAIKEYLI